jgi:hypothetical protein
MRRLLHGVLGAWFLIAMSMAQGCMVPAQSSNPSRDAIVNSSANNGGSSSSVSTRTAQSNAPINTRDFVPDPGASSALTDHFKHNRLPLVGAQVLRNPSTGARAVVLYGFVGSDLGKSDAQRQADDFINDASVDVDNRIRVNPDLLTARGSSSDDSPDSAPDTLYTRDPSTPPDAQANAAPSMPGVQSYVDQQNQSAQIQQYQQQNAMGSMSSMVPLIALLGMLSAGMASGNGSFATGPRYSPYGYSSSPYGNSPFPSYGGYPPGMAPPTFGTPGYGFGGSPGFGGSMGGGVTPFGSLPGSPYYYHP